MPVRAKLLAAGSATCAYRIAAKAVAFLDCPALGNRKVTHSAGCWGLAGERAFVWAPL